METKVDLVAAEIDLAKKVDPASVEVDFVGDNFDSATTELNLALENFDLVVEDSISASSPMELVLVSKLYPSVVGCRGSRLPMLVAMQGTFVWLALDRPTRIVCLGPCWLLAASAAEEPVGTAGIMPPSASRALFVPLRAGLAVSLAWPQQ
jgi:hypothetical protein